MSEIVIGNELDNPFLKNSKPLVSKIEAPEDPKNGILKAVDAIGGFEKVIDEGDRVLLKPNYNSVDSPPASTDPQFLRALVELLYDSGAGKVFVGESSWQALKTRKALTETGVIEALKGSGAEIAFFDEGDFVDVKVGGNFLEKVGVSKQAMGFDKLVYSCCMKTHYLADFSFSLKLAFGFTDKKDRPKFHLVYLKEKLVDLNLIIRPNLIIMDGRKCFISGGPFKGEVRKPNLILASGDRVAMDVESIKVVAGFKGSKLKDNPWSYTQVIRAAQLGLGVKSDKEYNVVED